MRSTAYFFSVIAILSGCQTTPATTTSSAPAASASASIAAAAPVASSKPESRFGERIDTATPFVALAEIVKEPKKFEGQRLRTRGEVVAVCQAAGCWTDLRPEGTDAAKVPVPTHVSMHRHAFFLPKDIKGKSAEIEGTISVRTLTQDECDHYNGEGASLVAGAPVVGVDAVGVAVR